MFFFFFFDIFSPQALLRRRGLLPLSFLFSRHLQGFFSTGRLGSATFGGFGEVAKGFSEAKPGYSSRPSEADVSGQNWMLSSRGSKDLFVDFSKFF